MAHTLLYILAIWATFGACFGLAWLYALVLYWADRHEKEPKRLLLGMFLWGATVAIVGAALFSEALDAGIALFVPSPDKREFLSLAFTAPVVEESLKGLALVLLFLFSREEVDSLFDGLIYAALVGLGFEAMENVLYLVMEIDHGLADYFFLMVLRLGLFGFTHAFFTAFTGLGLTFAWLRAKTWWAWAAVPLGWLLAVLAHAFHNATLTLDVPWCLLPLLADWSGLFFLIGVALWAFYRERRWIRTYLREEVAAGLITPAHYATISALHRRAQALRLARRQGAGEATAAFYAKLAKLAFLKARQHQSGHSMRRAQAIAQLRAEIARLAPEAQVFPPS